ncbi:MAG: hypothetical protein WCH46_01650 [bacterium]
MAKARIVASIILVCTCAFGIPNAIAQHLTSPAHNGVAPVPIGEDVYLFLRHLSVKGLVNDYSEIQLPISENEVVLLLQSVDTNHLSTAERSIRRKYLRTYDHNPSESVTMFSTPKADGLFFTGIPTDKDKYLYIWKDDTTFSDLEVHGLGNLEFRERTSSPKGNVVLGLLGGRFSGTLSGHVGFFMQTTDGRSFGDSTIALEDPVISKNKNYSLYSNHTFFDFTTAELAYNYDWFTAKLGREAIAIGGGYQGENIIVSPTIQAPDYVSLGAHVGAVRYQAIVASILGEARFSDKQDSTHYAFGPGSYIDPKFLVLHDLTFMIGKDVEFGFTDMTIFSRRFDLAYVQPFAFLKSVEHSLNDRDNSLLATHFRWRVTNGFELRGQGLLDDVLASKIGTGFWGNKFAWQIGGIWSAPFGLEDVDFAFEHTRVEPFTYSHFNQQNTFATSGQILGSSIGPNSVSYWGQLRWAPSEKVAVEISLNLTERGENYYDSTGKLKLFYDKSGNIMSDGNQGGDFEHTVAYGDGERTFHILDGNRVNIVTIDAQVSYELWRGLNVFLRSYSKSVNYLTETPAFPLEKAYGFVAFGAKAIF